VGALSNRPAQGAGRPPWAPWVRSPGVGSFPLSESRILLLYGGLYEGWENMARISSRAPRPAPEERLEAQAFGDEPGEQARQDLAWAETLRSASRRVVYLICMNANEIYGAASEWR
jgi:hypothetical protein